MAYLQLQVLPVRALGGNRSSAAPEPLVWARSPAGCEAQTMLCMRGSCPQSALVVWEPRSMLYSSQAAKVSHAMKCFMSGGQPTPEPQR